MVGEVGEERTGFAVRLAALMARRGMGVRELARQVPCNRALISRYLNGHQAVSPGMAARLDGLLGAGGELVALASCTGRRGQVPVRRSRQWSWPGW